MDKNYIKNIVKRIKKFKYEELKTMVGEYQQ